MAFLRNVARDVQTGAAITTGDAEIRGPDGVLLDSVPVDPTTGFWQFQENGSPGFTEQTFAAGGQTKKIDGSAHGQAGTNFEGEWDRILRLFGDGVITGMAVTAPGGMAVQVGTGDLLNKGTLHPIYTAETVNISAADGSNPRIDLVVSELTRTGTFEGRVRLQVVEGTPAASPTAPTLTDDATTSEIEVARVTVPAAAAAIVLGNIDETERPIATGPLADGSVTQAKLAKPSVGTPELFDEAVTLAKTADGLTLPFLSPGLIATYWVSAVNVLGGEVSGPDSLGVVSQDTLCGSIIFVPKPTTLTGIGVRRAGGTTASATGRLGLYAVGSNGLPSVRVHDAGTIDLSTSGVKSVTGLSVTFNPGWYWATVCAGTFAGTLQLETLRVRVSGGGSDPAGFDIARPLHGWPEISATSSPEVLWSAQGVFVGTGALPDPYPSPGLASSGPLVWIQTSGS